MLPGAGPQREFRGAFAVAGFPQFAALRYCFNKPWNEVPPLRRKQDLTRSSAPHSPDSSRLMRKKKKKRLEGWKISLRKRVEGVDSSQTVTTSVWNLLGQMTRSRTAAFYFSEPSQCFHSKGGMGMGGGLEYADTG